MLLAVGIPIFLLELAIGQKFQTSGAVAFRSIHPTLAGVGIAASTITFIVALYYNIIVAWSLWFLFHSFTTGPLPWDESAGGALRFWEVSTLQCRPSDAPELLLNGTAEQAAGCTWTPETPWPQEPGIFATGGLVWPLVGCLALAWVLVWLCVYKGIASAGKVAWVTALLPYAVLLVFLIRGFTLEGAHEGLRFFLVPNFSRLADPLVWVQAASQIFYSTGIGWGTLIAFSSYNEPNHNFVRDAWLVPLINCGTSFLAGLVVFSTLGFMAHSSGVAVEDLQLQGSGLAFVVYPAAISQMPASPFFAVLFFVMLLCLGIDSQFSMVETVLSALGDSEVLPQLTRAQRAAAVCTLMFLLGLVFVTRGGLHWVNLVDSYSANLTLFMIGAIECVAVAWHYGTHRLAGDVLQMTGWRLPKAVLWNYKYAIPVLLAILVVQSMVSSIISANPFPPAAVGLGWVIALVSAVPIVVVAAWVYVRSRKVASPATTGGLPQELPPSKRGAVPELTSVASDVLGEGVESGVEMVMPKNNFSVT